ncbi:MAG: ABC transporter ATP-binding protein [Chloroflexi bacterium]|nr:MAG: ABC transporter ATP-binding protein [Chloroflexota bacterium]
MIRTAISNISQYVNSIGKSIKLIWQTYPAALLGLSIIVVLQGGMPLAMAWIIKLLFDALEKGLSSNDSIPWAYLAELLIIQAILALGSQALSATQSYLNAELVRRLTIRINSIVYEKVNSFVGIAYFEDPNLYDTIRLAQEGAEQSTFGIIDGMMSLGQGLVTLISFLGVLLAFNPLLALLVFLSALPHLYTQIKFGYQRFGLAFGLSPQHRERFFYSSILSNPEAAKEIRLFNLGSFFLKRLLRLFEFTQNAERQQQLHETRWNLILSVFSSLVSWIIFVVVVLQAFSKQISFGDVTLYISTAEAVNSALIGIVVSLSGLNQDALFYTYFQKLLALPQPIPLASHPKTMRDLEDRIEFRHVSFRYSERHPWVLHDVSFIIPAGQCLALVGLNGAGKTTIVKLLTRLYDPVEGQILWDGIDIREFDPIELRRQLGIVFQDFMHYDLAAQENIGLGDVQHIENIERVRQAAMKAGIHERIEQLPQGYQTQVSLMFGGKDKDGVNVDLSGGEWQKIALARMFMRNANFLILDEPTAALDAQAEYDIYNRFVELVAGKTSLLISHRFSTVRMANWIAVLEDGKVTEYGSHNQLMALGGRYMELYNMQANRYQ